MSSDRHSLTHSLTEVKHYDTWMRVMRGSIPSENFALRPLINIVMVEFIFIATTDQT